MSNAGDISPSPFDPIAHAARVVRLFHRGIFTRSAALSELSDLIEPDNVAAIMEQLPLEWHDLLRERIAGAPTTEEGWQSLIYVGSYCGPELSESEWKAWEAEQLQNHRRCIESLRQYFAEQDRSDI